MAQYVIDNCPTPIHFECSNDPVTRTLQRCKNLLMARQGEVPYDRFRGFNTAFFDLPISEINDRLMEELDRVMLWEPNAEVVSGKAFLDENGKLVIRVMLTD